MMHIAHDPDGHWGVASQLILKTKNKNKNHPRKNNPRHTRRSGSHADCIQSSKFCIAMQKRPAWFLVLKLVDQ